MKRICIIKIGATGDVVRTTPILHLYKNKKIEIYWITAKKNKEILPGQLRNLKIFSIEDIDLNYFLKVKFNLVISLDDDYKCAELATKLKSEKLVGIFLDKDKIVYTIDSNEWFDMGLSSRFGKEKADKLKWKNKKSYQEILFNILGYKFKGEKYLLPKIRKKKNINKKIIGIENRAGIRWPTKVWTRYKELEFFLKYKGYKVIYFKDRNTMKKYIEDISKVSFLFCGDTLAMHIGLGLNIPTVSIFTCTSPQEIYGYNILEKVISKKLKKAFYKTSFVKEAVDSILLEDVIKTGEKIGLKI